MFKNVFSLYTQRHGFHLVDPSAMPLLTSISALTLTTGSVLFFHGYKGGLETTFFWNVFNFYLHVSLMKRHNS
jgi:hypothetical protein